MSVILKPCENGANLLDILNKVKVILLDLGFKIPFEKYKSLNRKDALELLEDI